MTYLVPLAPRANMALIDNGDWSLVEPYGWYEVQDGRVRYAYANHDGTTVKMHRLVMEAALGRPLDPGELVDHINHHGLDNRRSNLRLATHSQNHANVPKPQKRNGRASTSRFKGVYLYANGRWRAQIRVQGKRISLGYYETEEEAARAYDRAALEHFGEFAYLNFP